MSLVCSLRLSDERQLLRLLALVIAPNVKGRDVAQMTISLLVDAADLVGSSLAGEALEDAVMHLLFVEGRILVNLIVLVFTRDLAYRLGLA